MSPQVMIKLKLENWNFKFLSQDLISDKHDDIF